MTRKRREQAVIAVNRFGLGARPGELEEVARDPREWVLAQLEKPASAGKALDRLPDSQDYQKRFTEWRQRFYAARRAAEKNNGEADEPGFGQTFRQELLDEVNLRAAWQCETPSPVMERLVMFWSNHFTVSAEKQMLRLLAGSMEREVIRPGMSGDFASMLLAVEQHPAMLLYLDNIQSIGPDSPAGRRQNQMAEKKGKPKRGLNENLGREILELHTLGVDGGYQQQDVEELARGITGWRPWFASRKAPKLGEHGSVFVNSLHQPGERFLMGRNFEQKGAVQGRSMLRHLASRPETAGFVAHKLARHFVADEPPKALVKKLASTYQSHQGKLLPVYRALFTSEEAWQPGAPKFRRPDEYLIAVHRALNHQPDVKRGRWRAEMKLLGQLPFQPGAPAGWGDRAGDWIGADGLWKRVWMALRYGRYLDKDIDPMELALASIGPALSEETSLAISTAANHRQGTALVLASPEFQWR